MPRVSPSDPAEDIVLADISSTDFTPNFLAYSFEVGTSGNIVIVTGNGSTRTLPVVAGRLYPVVVRKVVRSGTTAADILLYA